MTAAQDSNSDVLIIGAGLAGLAAAQELSRGGAQVTLLDKARGVSGRSSTRRLSVGETAGAAGAAGEARLDHGARFLTARHARTQALVQQGLEAGWLAEWTHAVPQWQAGQLQPEGGGHPRYVPPGGMNVLGRELARELQVLNSAQVTQLHHQGSGWRAECADGRAFGAKTLLLNLPAPQIVPLLAGTDIGPAPLEPLRTVAFDPCWAVGALLAHDLDGAAWKALRLQDHPALDWIAREHTKRPPGHPPALMLHARADWSRQQLETDPAQVTAALLEASRRVLESLDIQLPAVLQSFAHRWRYATPTARFPQPFGWLPQARLGWCGDWCTPDPHGPRVEAALLSGWALAAALADS